LNENFNSLGFAIIALFILAWAVSVIAYRYTGLDNLEIGPARD
jgi:high-affinity nickel-transport protein